MELSKEQKENIITFLDKKSGGLFSPHKMKKIGLENLDFNSFHSTAEVMNFIAEHAIKAVEKNKITYSELLDIEEKSHDEMMEEARSKCLRIKDVIQQLSRFDQNTRVLVATCGFWEHDLELQDGCEFEEYTYHKGDEKALDNYDIGFLANEGEKFLILSPISIDPYNNMGMALNGKISDLELISKK